MSRPHERASVQKNSPLSLKVCSKSKRFEHFSTPSGQAVRAPVWKSTVKSRETHIKLTAISVLSTGFRHVPREKISDDNHSYEISRQPQKIPFCSPAKTYPYVDFCCGNHAFCGCWVSRLGSRVDLPPNGTHFGKGTPKSIKTKCHSILESQPHSSPQSEYSDNTKREKHTRRRQISKFPVCRDRRRFVAIIGKR